jgi:thiol-disulfide isomerase/thioredoxin
MAKSWFKLSNLLNGAFLIMLVVFIFNPSAKALMIEGLMKVGLFQPNISKLVNTAPVNNLPDVLFENPDGKLIHLADQKGKVIFVNFWATWCPPCIAEMPSINKLYNKLKDNKNVVFIIVDADHNFQKSVPFMAKNHYNMPLYKLASNVPQNLVSNSIPATTIIDKNGQIVFHQDGSADYGNPKVLEYLNKISK